MPPRKSNGVGSEDARRVQVDREEYAALLAVKEAGELHVVDVAKTSARLHDLRVTCSAQARRLAEVDLIMQHQDRVNGLQRVLIDMLRADHPRVASLEELSEFWRQWSIATKTVAEKQPQLRDAVAKLEPDLFRSWGLWVRDVEKVVRSFSVAGTRTEVEPQLSIPQGELQDRAVGKLRETNAALVARVRELESEVEAYKLVRGKRPG